MRIATFNVHGWSDATGKKRIDDVIALLAELDCDALVLNEVVSPEHTLARVARALGLEPHWAEAGWGGNAILTRAPAREVESFTLDADGHLRSALAVRLDGPGGELDLVGAHLDHVSEALRLAQLDQLHAALARRSPRHVLAGDLNAMRLSDLAPPELALVQRYRARQGWEPARDDVMRDLDRRGYIDAVRLALAGSLQAYRQQLAAPLPRAHAVTCRVDTRIDWILLSGALSEHVHVSGARTRRTDVSDHHPVVIDLTVTPR
ncbi:MAG: endonuclease/exonuclease/phosphatase family protein [Deltaproteobacteria bacterium]|nr:endonuclease/exonuclease/phosphatase family protein [Deltaproteobacteria bacterium]